MHIVKFQVVKTVELPSSTAVFSQVKFWSVWLRVKCGPYNVRAFEHPQRQLQWRMWRTGFLL